MKKLRTTAVSFDDFTDTKLPFHKKKDREFDDNW